MTGLCLLLKVDYVKAFILCQLIAAGCILTTLQPSHQIKTDDTAAQAAGDTAGQVTKEKCLKILNSIIDKRDLHCTKIRICIDFVSDGLIGFLNSREKSW